MNVDKLKTVADTYCDLYRLGKISREEAKESIVLFGKSSIEFTSGTTHF